MPRTYTCTLGFSEREFRYTRKERVEFEKRFGAGMWDVMKRHVLALNEDDVPTPGGMIEAQHALVWLGLRHKGPKVTEENVSIWLDEEAQKGGNVFAIYGTASNAVLASGVLGFKWEAPEVEDEEADPKEGSAEKTE